MQLNIVNLTGSTKTYLSGAISVAGSSTTAVTNTTQQLSLANDGQLRSDLLAALVQLTDGVNTYGANDALDYLKRILQVLVPIADTSGNGITSTLVGSKQSLDSNVSQIVPMLDNSGSGTISALNGAVTATTNGCASVNFNVTGTWAATLTIQGFINSTWVTIVGDVDATDTIESSFTANSYITVSCGGYNQVRIIATAYTSGTVNIEWNSGVGVNLVEVFNTNPSSLQAQVVGNITSLSADSGNPVKIGGVYNSSLPSPASGNRVDVQSDYKGRVIPAPTSLSYFHPIYTTRIQSVPAVTTVLSTSLTATIAATKAGNTIIVSACCNAGTLTITDSASQSYSTATTITGNSTQTSKIFYFPNTAAGVTTVTISSTSSTDLNLIVTEYIGILTASPLDQTSTHGQTATSSWTSNSTTTTAQASELLIGATMGTLHNNATFTAGTGWGSVATVLNVRGGANLELYMQDQNVTATGTYASTGTNTGNDDMYASIATFKYVVPNTLTLLNAATTIKSGQGTLANIIINTIGTGSASVTLYDSLSASGTIIGVLNLTGAVNSLKYDVHFANGLTMVVNSATPDFTVVYD